VDAAQDALDAIVACLTRLDADRSNAVVGRRDAAVLKEA
jgi:hypothetical protein